MTRADDLRRVARDHGITLEVTADLPGPTVTAYRMTPAPGVKPSKVAALVESWTLELGVPVRYLGAHRGHLVLEVPNKSRRTVELREMPYVGDELSVPIGVGLDGPISVPLESLPHMLVAGATGQGKSVYLNDVLTFLLQQAGPDKLSLLLVDPKRVELTAYASLPHLLLPVARDVNAAREVLEHAVGIMEHRYRMMETAGVKKASELADPPSRLVVVVDELADLMMTGSKAVEEMLVRIAAVGRAASVHLIVATQYPKKEVITSLIKQNIPTKVAFTVNDHVASNLILGTSGAEALTGKGDALVMLSGATRAVRVQAPMVSDEEVAATVAAWASVAPIAPFPASMDVPVASRAPEGPPVDEVVAAWALEQIVKAERPFDGTYGFTTEPPAPELTDLELLREAYLHGSPAGHEERIASLERQVREQGRVIRLFENLLRTANMLPTGGE